MRFRLAVTAFDLPRPKPAAGLLSNGLLGEDRPKIAAVGVSAAINADGSSAGNCAVVHASPPYRQDD
jgi:hypothetical protein